MVNTHLSDCPNFSEGVFLSAVFFLQCTPLAVAISAFIGSHKLARFDLTYFIFGFLPDSRSYCRPLYIQIRIGFFNGVANGIFVVCGAVPFLVYVTE